MCSPRNEVGEDIARTSSPRDRKPDRTQLQRESGPDARPVIPVSGGATEDVLVPHAEAKRGLHVSDDVRDGSEWIDLHRVDSILSSKQRVPIACVAQGDLFGRKRDNIVADRSRRAHSVDVD